MEDLGVDPVWASLVAQMVKNSPAIWETWVRSLGQEDPLKKGMATHSTILALDRGAWQAIGHGVTKESYMIGRLTPSLYF